MGQAWGTITAFGTNNRPKINSGSGNFTIASAGDGLYTIDFKDGLFTKTPGLVVTQQFSHNNRWDDFSDAGGSTLDNTTIIALNKGQAKLKTGDDEGKAQDRNFSFIAIGD